MSNEDVVRRIHLTGSVEVSNSDSVQEAKEFLISKLDILDEHKDGARLFDMLSVIVGLIHQNGGNLTSAQYRETFRYDKLRVSLIFNEQKG